MKNNKKLILTVSMVGILLMLTNASAIGVSPGTIAFNNMVRGGYGEKTLGISTAGNEDLTIKLEAAGDTKDWITFDPTGQITVPKKSAKLVTVKIAVPNTARNGQYEGTIIISTLLEGADNSGQSGARFMPGIIVKVQLAVTGEQVEGYEVKSVSVKDTEQNYPVEFVVNVENTGNVITTPKLHFEILNSERKEIGKTMDYSETQIMPTTTKQFTIKMPTKGMETGAYYAKMTSNFGDEQTLFFQILAPGTLAIRGSIAQLSLNKIWVKPQETVKIEATFTNEGEVFIDSAKIKGEAYLIDPTYGTKELVGTFEGDSMTVPIGQEVSLTSYFTPAKSGRYSIEGIVVYSGKRTDVKTTVLNVLEEPKSYTLYYLAIGLFVILVVFYLTRMTEDGRTRRFKKMWGDYLSLK
ncbi:MAG: hypothetical protein PHG85_02320 [Candidatus Altiarchaeota archaeon]|nr:hypothetical protein [Candidatus Altiarchaeota archaeon]